MKPINFDGMILMVPEYAKFVTKDMNGNIYASELKPAWYESEGIKYYMHQGKYEWVMRVKHEPVYLEIV